MVASAAPAPGAAGGIAGSSPTDEIDAFVTFGLDSSVFAISVRHVREVLDNVELTHLPNAPHGVMGFIDVRGQSIGVLSLRDKLGFAHRAPGQEERILILEIESQGEAVVLGVLADCVFEVTPLSDAPLDAAPRLGRAWDSRFIAGIARRHGRFVVILDAEQVFTDVELAPMAELFERLDIDAPDQHPG